MWARDSDRQASFPDTKAAEYLAEQILAGDLAGDFTQGPLGEAQILREQLEGPRAAQDVGGVLHVPARPPKRIEMPAARGEGARFGILIPRAVLEVFAQ